MILEPRPVAERIVRSINNRGIGIIFYSAWEIDTSTVPRGESRLVVDLRGSS